MSGEYQYCFDNEYSSRAVKKWSWTVFVGLDSKAKADEAKCKLAHRISCSTHVTHLFFVVAKEDVLMEEIVRLRRHISAVKDMQQYVAIREGLHRNSKSTFLFEFCYI